MPKPPELPEPYTELGRFIRARREELRLTPKKFARKLNMSSRIVYLLETRSRKIHFKTRKRLARALQLDPAALQRFIGTARTTPIAGSIGQLIRSRRYELNLTQRQLGKKIGKTMQYISLIEAGDEIRLNRAGSTLGRLARALKLNIAELEAARPKRREKKIETKPNTLGAFLVTRRQELNLARAELGRLAEVAPGIIPGIEKGTYRLGDKTLVRLQKALLCEIPADLLRPL